MRSHLHERLKDARVPSPWDDGLGGLNGAFQVRCPATSAMLHIVSSTSDHPDTEGWEHVSVSVGYRLPNWIEMCFVKHLFWEEEECVVQYHPPKSEYVNNHPGVLHMWKHRDVAFPMPPTILVGIKGEVYQNAEEAADGMRRAIERGEI